MPERITKCLVLTGEERGSLPDLTSLLAEQGVCATLSAGLGECFSLLCAHEWHFLALDACAERKKAFHVLSQARQTWPDVPVLVFVKHGDIRTTVDAMKAGAFNCIEIPIDANLFRAAIRTLEGRGSRPPDDPLRSLTRVERIVLCHVLEGRTNREIADALSRSPRTIEVHRRHIMQKLDVSNLVDLVKRTMQTDSSEPRFADPAALGSSQPQWFPPGHP